MPHSDDGTRIEPLVVGPERQRHLPAGLTELPEPPEEPPRHAAGVMRLARGAVVNVLAGEVVGVYLAHVERARPAPAPAASRRSISGESCFDGGRSRLIFPSRHGWRYRRRRTGSSPRMAPASGPRGLSPGALRVELLCPGARAFRRRNR